MCDVIVIGAGPTGLACAIEAKRAGMHALVIDKSCLCNSLYRYPTNMIFFTSPELMEIGDLPLVTAGEKATRNEALKYYRKTAEHYELELRLYELVESVDGSDGRFVVHTRTEAGVVNAHDSRKLIIATGYYDLPNRLDVPGEELSHVSHYYTEAHALWGQDVVVIGGKNSAAEAALDLYRGGARVTLVHRRPELGGTIKYWVRPDIENRIKAGKIRALLDTRVTRIEREQVWVSGVRTPMESTGLQKSESSPLPLALSGAEGSGAEGNGNERPIPARAVFAMTGYHPDFAFLEQQGIQLDLATRRPAYNPETHESNVPGIYLAGVVIGGNQTGEIFIENGRFHGKLVIRAMAGKT